jgi:hypothetical protein
MYMNTVQCFFSILIQALLQGPSAWYYAGASPIMSREWDGAYLCDLGNSARILLGIHYCCLQILTGTIIDRLERVRMAQRDVVDQHAPKPT